MRGEQCREIKERLTEQKIKELEREIIEKNLAYRDMKIKINEKLNREKRKLSVEVMRSQNRANRIRRVSEEKRKRARLSEYLQSVERREMALKSKLCQDEIKGEMHKDLVNIWKERKEEARRKKIEVHEEKLQEKIKDLCKNNIVNFSYKGKMLLRSKSYY